LCTSICCRQVHPQRNAETFLNVHKETMKFAPARIFLLGLCLYAGAVRATNEAELTDGTVIGDMSIDEMGAVFARSEEQQTESMTLMMRSMTLEHAAEVLQKSNLSSAALTQAIGMAKGSHGKLRQPKGYAGLDGARKLLNSMIFESMLKYDKEIAKCTEYYSAQCAAMEKLRSEISASNFIAANSRALILDSQATINKCEVDIPTTKLELSQHKLKCEHELYKMNARLKIVLGDIAVMTTILKMTDCNAKKFIQMEKLALLHCEDHCNKQSFITFKDDELRQEVDRLQSTSKKLMTDTFKDLFAGIQGLEAAGFELVQLNDTVAPVINKTKYNNPPLPMTKVPGNPCTDPHKGAPSPTLKRSAKCTLGKGQCYKLQERFLLIQSGIEDERDALTEQIASMEGFCKETAETLQGQIDEDNANLENAQTKLAQATEKEATAGEVARKTAQKHESEEADLKKQMKTCNDNYLGFESELCALKKIRGELYKMKGDGGSAFFQDCQVSNWDPEECTKECASGNTPGEQILTRKVLTSANGGADCLPLEAVRKCNTQPCPVDCKVAMWSGWSKCSAECGGGVTQRLREVEVAAKYGGHPCGKTSETKACNGQACEKDCELSDWTVWSSCSKDCDGGTQKRQKFIKEAAEGAGKCADGWEPTRLEYKKCNAHRCDVAPNAPLACNKSLDVVLLLDGSGSLGQKGWDAEIKAANMFVDAFMEAPGKTQISVILYSGPSTWGGVYKCTGPPIPGLDLEATCKIKKVTEFEFDLEKVKKKINALSWPKGSTLTSLALMQAHGMLPLGRPDRKSVVVAITDGRPLSYRRTYLASRMLRKAARLMWVPVTKYAPLKFIKRCATRRWQENVVKVDSFDELETAEITTHIIANMCPDDMPVLEMSRL